MFAKGSPHVVLSATRVTELGDHAVRVDRIHPGFSEVIDFDYAVLATGSTYNNAFQPQRGETLEQIAANFAAAQAGIKKATSILIAGGGPTGIELAGEIKALYPGKKVTLVTSGAHFTPGEFSPKLGQKLAAQLKAAKVDFHFNTRLDTGTNVTGPIPLTPFSLPKGGSIKSDFLIVAYGTRPNLDLVHAFDPAALSAAGYVRINKASLQVVGHPSLLAIGDVADTPDGKTAVAAMGHAAVAAANIVTLLGGKKTALKPWAPQMKAILVSFGPKGGARSAPSARVQCGRTLDDGHGQEQGTVYRQVAGRVCPLILSLPVMTGFLYRLFMQSIMCLLPLAFRIHSRELSLMSDPNRSRTDTPSPADDPSEPLGRSPPRAAPSARSDGR